MYLFLHVPFALFYYLENTPEIEKLFYIERKFTNNDMRLASINTPSSVFSF